MASCYTHSPRRGGGSGKGQGLERVKPEVLGWGGLGWREAEELFLGSAGPSLDWGGRPAGMGEQGGMGPSWRGGGEDRGPQHTQCLLASVPDPGSTAWVFIPWWQHIWHHRNGQSTPAWQKGS